MRYIKCDICGDVTRVEPSEDFDDFYFLEGFYYEDVDELDYCNECYKCKYPQKIKLDEIDERLRGEWEEEDNDIK